MSFESVDLELREGDVRAEWDADGEFWRVLDGGVVLGVVVPRKGAAELDEAHWRRLARAFSDGAVARIRARHARRDGWDYDTFPASLNDANSHYRIVADSLADAAELLHGPFRHGEPRSS